MQPRPRRRLRTRLIAAFLAPMLVTLVVGTAVFYWLARQALEEELGLRLIAVAQAAAAGLPVEQVGQIHRQASFALFVCKTRVGSAQQQVRYQPVELPSTAFDHRECPFLHLV